MKGKLSYILILLLLVIVSFGTGVIANETIMTFVGEDELEVYSLVTPAKRIDTVYKQGDSKVFIKCSNTLLIPVGEGTSMYPMVAEGHLILVTTDHDEIQVGDFIVVDNLTGRYFHQVVIVKEDEKGLVFTTRGINNTGDDIVPVFREDIVGIAIAVFW